MPIAFSAGLIQCLQFFSENNQVYVDYHILICGATRTVQNESSISTAACEFNAAHGYLEIHMF